MAPAPLSDVLSGRISAPPETPPEITAFELPENAPTWGFEVLDLPLETELPNIKSFIDRTSTLALLATKAALNDAGLQRETRPQEIEIGCSYGTTLGCLEAMGIFWNKVKTTNPKFAQPLPFTQGYANSPSSLMCIEFGLRGPAATFSGERLAGLEALMFAFDQIAQGSGDIIVAGASDSLSPAAFNHLLATGQLSKKGDWEDGIIPGEGACMLVLESEDSARKRKARVYAELEGVNFFPRDPKSAEPPITFASDPKQTLVFVSTPNVHPEGGWKKPLFAADMPIFASKLYTGDMLAASPLLGVGLACGCLSHRFPVTGLCSLPVLHQGAQLKQIRHAIAEAYDPAGMAGVAMLRKTETQF